jgi:hypothetical protein
VAFRREAWDCVDPPVVEKGWGVSDDGSDDDSRADNELDDPLDFGAFEQMSISRFNKHYQSRDALFS